MKKLFTLLAILGCGCVVIGKPAAQTKGALPPLRIHMIGTGEYDAAESLGKFKKHLEASYRLEITASLGKDKSLANIEELRSADLLILFARRMDLPAEEMAIIREHCEKGKALIALRTASHAFQPDDNEWIGKVLGAKYLGPGSYTTPYRAIASETQKDHPILKGVGPIASKGPYGFGKFEEKAVVLQVVESDRKVKAPAAWTHEYKGGRSFYSTMGAAEDFQNADFRRMLENAIFWTTKREPEKVRSNRPNVVLILLDNLGQEWLGCYGSEEKRTPNIDRLAKQGVRFRHCYTPVVCGPSRIVMLTGRYPFRTGFTLHHDAALYSGGGLDPTREIVLARLLRLIGYRTGIVGKWQINNLYDQPGILKLHGFDEHLVWPGSINRDLVTGDELRRFRKGIQDDSVPVTSEITQKIESRYWDPVFLRNEQREVHKGKFGPDVMQAWALDFLDRHQKEPFFLYYPMVLTHGKTHTQPVVPTPDNLKEGRPTEEMFGDMVQYADKLVGEVVARLDKLSLRDNTIIIIATDNGTESRLSARFRGTIAKGGLYQLNEAGSDVGLIVNSPHLVPGGRDIALADFSDILPTVCDLTAAHRPERPIVDGKSHADHLRNLPTAKPARMWIFNQYHTRRVVRDERFKLYSTGELFDAEADRQEEHDLAGSKDKAVLAARARLEQVLKSFPKDVAPPFLLLSQSAFKLRTAEREEKK
jgi:arylsulfatase A-like enzyme/type 1 glutamine amidotransferase